MIKPDIAQFFHNQRFTVITTIDRDGSPHNSCKGIVDIDLSGKVYLLDLYMGKTYGNLKNNPNISITAVDEHRFTGYSLKGKARIIQRNKVSKRILKLWGDKVNSRISHRVLRNMKGEKGHKTHPEALLPMPAYLIEAHVDEIVDLTPSHIKKEA